MKRLIPPCRRGISTVTSVFMLLLMFTIIVAVFLAYFQYNLAMAEQNKIEQERAQEKIILREMKLRGGNISNITITNVGTIEARIRALYEDVDGDVKFLFDPSRNDIHTHIAPGKNLTIDFPIAIPFNPEAKIIAATERGVKTIEYESLLIFGSPPKYNTTELYIGPLMLVFNDFQYQEIDNKGNPVGEWRPGWNVTEGITCAWRIRVKNVGNKSITINYASSLNLDLASAESPTIKSWYLKENSKFLPVNETVSIVYLWNSPGGTKPQSVPLASTPSPCMVFLTFFGVFHETGGRTTPYAQTIPFQALIIVPKK